MKPRVVRVASAYAVLVAALVSAQTGDFNMDGVVNLEDFLVMAENFNSSFEIGEVSFSKGDNNIDGHVNLADFIELRAIFNAPAGASAASVPEPGGLLLVLVGLLALYQRRTDHFLYTSL